MNGASAGFGPSGGHISGRGRPLRFLAVLAGGWVTLRAAMLWNGTAGPGLPPPRVPSMPARPPIAFAARPGFPSAQRVASTQQAIGPRRPVFAALGASPLAGRVPDPKRVALALLGLSRFGESEETAGLPAPILPGVPQGMPARGEPAGTARFSGSFWLVARGGSGGIAPGVVGGQLGGSQAGLRVAWVLNRRHRVALAARVTGPLHGNGRELALGAEWQPTRLPVRLVAEQRIALDGGLGGPALGVVGGVGPLALGHGFRLEAYGQAGAIRRATTDLYADGAVRVAHPVATLGPARLDLGAGAWGGAQRGAARLDLGPSLTLALPVAGQPLRLSLDYRARVAGDARPGSGPALTLGADF